MSADELIELVREYKFLYDPKNKDYKDHLVRTTAWEEIGHRLKLPAVQCKENWGKLRNAFLGAIKRRKTKSGQAASTITAWKYEDQMMFLRPYIEMRTTKTNLIPSSPESPLTDCQTEEYSPPEFNNESESREISSPNIRSSDESQRSSSFKRSVSGNRKPDIGDIYELMKNSDDFRRERHQFKQDMDETDLFFLSMSKAAKALPKLERTKIKLDLHTAISQAEIRQISKTEHVLNTPINITSKKIIPPRNQSRDQQAPSPIQPCTSPSTSSSSRTYYFPNLPTNQTCNSPLESESILNPQAQISDTTVEENVLVFYPQATSSIQPCTSPSTSSSSRTYYFPNLPTNQTCNSPLESESILNPRSQISDTTVEENVLVFYPQATSSIQPCTSPSTSSSSRTYYLPNLPTSQTCNSPPESESILNPRSQISDTTVEEKVLVFYKNIEEDEY